MALDSRVSFRVPAKASIVAPHLGGHTTGHRVPEKRRWQGRCLSYIVRGYMLEVVRPTFASSPFLPSQTDVRRRVEPRPTTLELSSPLLTRSVQPAMAPNSAAIVGLARPPPGVTPNFAHPESRGYRISITLVVCLVLCTGVVLVRLYTRYFITRMIGADDCKYPNSREKFYILIT
jgi:hypothetical protein